MAKSMIHPLHITLPGSGTYEAIFEMSPLVQLTSFSDGMSPQDLLFKA